MTRLELEAALDSGKLEVQWANGTWHSVRRNGASKTWKRDPLRFAIPVKTGFRDCFIITSTSSQVLDSYLRII